MPNLLHLILFFLIFFFLFDLLVRLLNLKALNPILPEEFTDIYSSQKYRESQDYLRANSRIGIISDIVGFIGALIFLLFLIRPLQLFSSEFGTSSILQGLLFMGTIGLVSSLLRLPFSYYSTFVIEEKFGFNRTTPKTFIVDRLKGLLLALIIGAPVLAAILAFFEKGGSNAWLYCWLFVVFFQLIMQFLVPTFIMPLFNKFEKLPEGSLRQAIKKYAQKQNFELQGVYTMDGSKRSTKANAFFTGFGKFRRIVLFDTLISNHTEDELLAVLAHEMGHCKLHHIQKMVLSSCITTGLTFFIMGSVISSQTIYNDFGIEGSPVHVGLTLFSFLFAPISLLMGITGNIFSRKYEFEADAFSVQTYQQPQAMITALKKLSADNLSNLTPHPLKVFLEYSHPPALKRIEAIRKVAKEPLK